MCGFLEVDMGCSEEEGFQDRKGEAVEKERDLDEEDSESGAAGSVTAVRESKLVQKMNKRERITSWKDDKKA